VSLRARPFAWKTASGTPSATASRVSIGLKVIKSQGFWEPEAVSNAILAVVDEKGGAKGMSILALAIFAAAFAMALDAAQGLSGFGTASILGVLFLPLAMGDSAPDPWLYSAFFASAFLQVMVRARRRLAPPMALMVLPVLAAVWPLFHSAGVLLVPFLAVVTAGDCLLAWWADESAPQGGIYTAPVDPLLFREEDLDIAAFLKVLTWETKTNQFVHQRLGLTAAQLSSLHPSRAVEVLNSLLTIPDLPAQIGVPDPGANGDYRARNRQMLEIQYRDALKPGIHREKPDDGQKPLPHLPLWAPLSAAVFALAAVAATPAGRRIIAGIFSTMSAPKPSVSVPPEWWVSASRTEYPAAPYFWAVLIFFLLAGLVGAVRGRERYSAAFFIGGLALFTLVLPIPEAAPLVALAAMPFAASFFRGLWREDTLTRSLSFAAGLIVLLVGLQLVDWDYMPFGAGVGLGSIPTASTIK
jgi:hypothetical protein